MTKTTLGLIDLHTHLIPAIDDGPRLLEETTEALRIAHQNGVRSVVATPHMFLDPYDLRDPEQVQARFAEMNEALGRIAEGPEFDFLNEMTIHLGAENYACQAFLEALERKAVLTLAGSRYVLVEFTPVLSKRLLLGVVEKIQDQGLVPVLAHIERYQALRDKPDELQKILERGCLTQVNLGSLLRPFWSRRGRLARGLVKLDLVSLIASDTHGPRFRTPCFQILLEKYSDGLGPERLQRLCSENPAWILSGANKLDYSTSNSS